MSCISASSLWKERRGGLKSVEGGRLSLSLPFWFSLPFVSDGKHIQSWAFGRIYFFFFL